MAQAGRTTTYTGRGSQKADRYKSRDYGNGRGEKNIYIYDNTARKLDIDRELKEEPRRKLSNETRKNRDKARHMSFGYVMFLAAALCTCAYIFINYIQLRSELTTRRENVSDLERRLNMLKLENDDKYYRIANSIDLEEIKRIAIGELGMVYAKEGQIINYTNAGTDYMRRIEGE